MVPRSKLHMLAVTAMAFMCALTVSPARAGVDTETLNGLELNVASGSGTTKYLIEFVTITAGGPGTNNWFEVPYLGPSYQANFVNLTGSNLTLSDAGFFISPTQIPLDQLNVTDTPPTGSASSPFSPVPGFDGTLAPGGSFGPSVPELSTMMLLGFAGLALIFRRKSVRASWSVGNVR